jgi:hypothetical protein
MGKKENRVEKREGRSLNLFKKAATDERWLPADAY